MFRKNKTMYFVSRHITNHKLSFMGSFTKNDISSDTKGEIEFKWNNNIVAIYDPADIVKDISWAFKEYIFTSKKIAQRKAIEWIFYE